MVSLVAFTLYVLPPVPLGRYSTIQQCELDRSALVEQIARKPNMSEVTLICQNLEYRPSVDALNSTGKSNSHVQSGRGCQSPARPLLAIIGRARM